MRKSKLSTARVVVARELGVSNSYPMEASMAGALNSHFSPGDLEGVGHALCLAIADATCEDETPILSAVESQLSSLSLSQNKVLPDDDEEQ